METNYRYDVMKTAHEIYKATMFGWSVCLAKAWKIYRLQRSLNTGMVRFSYRKADGSIRLATGTLRNGDSIPQDAGKKNYRTCCYYDVEAGGIRSFRIENLVAIY